MSKHLTQQDRLDIQDAQSYLKAHADMDFEKMPEKTLAGLFNQLSPAAREYLKAQQRTVENFRTSGGREMPFAPKRSLADLNLPEHVGRTIAKADEEEGIRSLHERMGTAEQQSRLNDQPTSRRDMIEAAFTEHEGAEHD